MNHLDFILAYESGRCDHDEIVAGFQAMIDDGTVWQLQGAYGRTACGLLENGECHRPQPKPPQKSAVTKYTARLNVWDNWCLYHGSRRVIDGWLPGTFADLVIKFLAERGHTLVDTGENIWPTLRGVGTASIIRRRCIGSAGERFAIFAR